MRQLEGPSPEEDIMREQFHADGDTWRVTSSGHDQRRAVRTVVFHCVSNAIRPYRVVEVPDGLLEAGELDLASEQELTELFNRSHTMDYSHDAAANPESHGYGDPPLG
jgi:hypothetical protein